MKPAFRAWLEGQKYDPATVSSRLSGTARVEERYGDLDQHFADDQMASVLSTLRYTTDDKRRGRPNPSRIPINGDVYNGLATCRSAVELYRRFRLTTDDIDGLPVQVATKVAVAESIEDLGQRIGLERDLQASLRLVIDQLESGLIVIDDGAERSVESGFIDITARDTSGATVVIELKAGVASQRAVAQICSYMGDIAAEDGETKVRGILVASDFDAKAKSAARMVPTLMLRRYAVQFRFSGT
jgi:endonuclease